MKNIRTLTVIITVIISSLSSLLAGPLSLNPKLWWFENDIKKGWPVIEYNPGGSAGTKTKPAYVQFAFPLSKPNCALVAANFFTPTSCNHTDYLQQYWQDANALASAHSITMTYSVVVTSGKPVFDFHTEPGNTCAGKPTVRILIEKWQDSYCGDISENPNCVYQRWWCDTQFGYIAPGTFTITAPLDPSQWSSVFGEAGTASAAALAGWIDCIQNIGMLGFTMGGGCFFGHGIFIDQGTGTANFVMTNFALQ